MALQAYIDDSQDDASGTYVLAGYISSKQNWNTFSQEWRERLPLAIVQEDGRFRFKMSEMALFGRMENVPAFYNLIQKYAQYSVACVINKNELREVIDSLHVDLLFENGSRIPVFIDHNSAFWNSPYYLTYYSLLDNFFKTPFLRRELLNINESVDFYFDDCSEKKPLLQGWNDFVNAVGERSRAFIGAAPRFVNDEEFLPLQAADFFAWWMRSWVVKYGIENIKHATYPFPKIDKKISALVMYAKSDHLFEIIRHSIQSNIMDGKFDLFFKKEFDINQINGLNFTTLITRR